MKAFRNKWIYFAGGWSAPALVYQVGSDKYESQSHIQIYIGWGKLFIYLPWVDESQDFMEERQYGVQWIHEEKSDAIRFCWGKWHKCITMPWTYTWIRTSTLMKFGWWHETKGNRLDWTYYDQFQDAIAKEKHPYRYRLQSGITQRRTATISQREMEWRPIATKWFPIFRLIRRSIEVEFSKEVGERSGSWKGGTVGCGYDLKPNETPLECLRRMEKERKF